MSDTQPVGQTPPSDPAADTDTTPPDVDSTPPDTDSMSLELDSTPRDPTAEDTDSTGWWGLGSDAQAAAWRSDGGSLLEDLRDVPAGDADTTTFAWQPGYELAVQGHGGFVGRERRRYTLVGHKGHYLSDVGGHQTVVADYLGNRAQKNRLVSIERPDNTSGMDAPWGLDRLTVEGGAEYTFNSRTLMMSGTVERTWNGGVMRVASMEGIVCGGSLVRAIGGPSATLSGMATADVYGGIGRVAGVRSYLAVLKYRAAKDAAWAMGLYVRNATFVIEPLFAPSADAVPKSNVGRKMGRLQRTIAKAKKAAAAVARSRAGRTASSVGGGVRMICPLVDIVVGVVMLPFAIVGIVRLIASLVRGGKAIAVPPVGPPRIRIRNGIDVSMFTTKLFM